MQAIAIVFFTVDVSKTIEPNKKRLAKKYWEYNKFENASLGELEKLQLQNLIKVMSVSCFLKAGVCDNQSWLFTSLLMDGFQG